MEKSVANLSLEYIEDPIDARVITIFSDDNIIVDKKDISKNMDFCLSATTIKIVIESMKNKGIKYRFIFYLSAILDIIFNGYDAETGNIRGLKSIVNSRIKYVCQHQSKFPQNHQLNFPHLEGPSGPFNLEFALFLQEFLL